MQTASVAPYQTYKPSPLPPLQSVDIERVMTVARSGCSQIEELTTGFD
jgi:hypothetical protein